MDAEVGDVRGSSWPIIERAVAGSYLTLDCPHLWVEMISSDEWPRFSLHAGAATCCLVPESGNTDCKLLETLSSTRTENVFTAECWLQVRSVPAVKPTHGSKPMFTNHKERIGGGGCWIIHTPTWGCGITADQELVVFSSSTWQVATSSHNQEATFLSDQKWYHIAVCCSYGEDFHTLAVYVGGKQWSLVERSGSTLQEDSFEDNGGYSDDDEPQRTTPQSICSLPIDTASSFRIGYAPKGARSVSLVLHELRVWETIVPPDALLSWSRQTVSPCHPHFEKLVAYWELCSASMGTRELDLSGNEFHLLLDRVCTSATPTSCWRRVVPRAMRPTAGSFVLRTFQDATSQGSCRFVIEVASRPEPWSRASCDEQQKSRNHPVVIFLLNFLCFKSARVTNDGEGASTVAILKSLIFGFSEEVVIGLRVPTPDKQEGVVLSLSKMTPAGKIKACKALDQLRIDALSGAKELMDGISHAVIDLQEAHEREQSNGPKSWARKLSFPSVVAINSETDVLTQPAPIGYEDDVNIYLIHLSAGSKCLVDPLPRQFIEYFASQSDQEWVFASVIHRICTIGCKQAHLGLEIFGPGAIELEEDGERPWSVATNKDLLSERPTHSIHLGLCATSECFRLCGTFVVSADSGHAPWPLVELTLRYAEANKTNRVARVSIRLRQDITNEFHIERALRNKASSVGGDNSLLLEQRGQLMNEKFKFHSSLVAREIAEAENEFKKNNIMKEELWARRKWIIGRGLRIFEEDELEQLCRDTIAAREQFQVRMHTLQEAQATAASGNRKGSGRTKIKRLKLANYSNHRPSSSSRPSTSELPSSRPPSRAGETTTDELSMEEQADDAALQHEKLVLKADIAMAQCEELESKIGEMFNSVRVAQSKGPVIMNDTRKSWMVKFQDLMRSKRHAFEMQRQKLKSEQHLFFLEQKQSMASNVSSEVKAINNSLLRYEKELSKRKKRVVFCMKDMAVSLEQEFEASTSLELAKQALRRCKMMQSPELFPEVYNSCVHVFFPLDASEKEVGSGIAQAASTSVHAVLFGLRHFCREETQNPFCIRMSHQETFMWLEREQRDTKASLGDFNTKKKKLQESCWAAVLFTYNALFSSPSAVSELKTILAIAQQTKRAVFHIELEAPISSLDEFKSKWEGRKPAVEDSHTPPPSVSVEKEYLVWRQNAAYLRTALDSLTSEGSQHTIKVNLQEFSCNECANSTKPENVDGIPLLPCLHCCWPVISRTAKPTLPDSTTTHPCDARTTLLEVVGILGRWLDDIPSSAIHSAVRNHHLDPRASSPFSIEWENFWTRRVDELTLAWEESFARRKQELDKQTKKLFKIYEEEASELTQLEHTFTAKKLAHHAERSEVLNNLHWEKALIETTSQLRSLREGGESFARAQEASQMVEEEVEQSWNETESWAVKLELAEEEDDVSPAAIARHQEIKANFHEALRRSCATILDAGRHFVENRSRKLNKKDCAQEEESQMEHLEFLSLFEKDQLQRVGAMYDDALAIVRGCVSARKEGISEEAKEFFEASRLEQPMFSQSSSDRDLVELRKQGANMQQLNVFSASVLRGAQLVELRMSMTNAYLRKAYEAREIFLMHNSPSFKLTVETTESPRKEASLQELAKLKDACYVNADMPTETWKSLQSMISLVELQSRCTQKAQTLFVAFKLRFKEEFVGAHLEYYWESSKSYLAYLSRRLSDTAETTNQSFQQKDQSERHFRAVVRDREQCKSRVGLLHTKLVQVKQRNQFVLGMLQQCRTSYEKATQMNEKLQNYKRDSLYKSWFQVGEFHVGSIGDLYDLRAKCAETISELEDEIVALDRKMERFDEMTRQRRLQWVTASITDGKICQRADRLQDLVHRALDYVIQTEESRVFHLLCTFDPRGTWIQQSSLRKTHAAFQLDQKRKGDHELDENLVQLCIARLDSVKQQKLRDGLKRKLQVFERMRKQEDEKLQVVTDELRSYRELNDILAGRVHFVEACLERANKGKSRPDQEPEASAVSPSKLKALQRSANIFDGCHDELSRLAVGSKKDHLHAESRISQLNWRIQEQLATGYRVNALIERLSSEVALSTGYLEILKRNDEELYLKGLAKKGEALSKTRDSSSSHYGFDLTRVCLVFEFYARQQWAKQSLDEMTSLSEKIPVAKQALEALPIPGKQSSEGDNDARSVAEDELLGLQLGLLINRFERRAAEQSSEATRSRLDTRVVEATLPSSIQENSQPPSAADSVFSTIVLHPDHLATQLFSWEICHQQQQAIQAALRSSNTAMDPRDAVGNVSEVIFGASLDHNEITQMYQVKSRAHVKESWNIVLVVVFFARLFRSAALKKAARKRKTRDSAAAAEFTRQLHERVRVARALRQSDGLDELVTLCRSTALTSVTSVGDPQLDECLRQALVAVQETRQGTVLMRIGDGLLASRPLHHSLAGVFDQSHDVRSLANKLAVVRAQCDRQPVPPSGLEVLSASNNAIKIKWRPAASGEDLYYAAEIQRWPPQEIVMEKAAPQWELAVCSDQSSHAFYNLRAPHVYCVRVRSGFSRTKWGSPSTPLFVLLRK